MFRFIRVTNPIFNEHHFTQDVAQKLAVLTPVKSAIVGPNNEIFIVKNRDSLINIRAFFKPVNLSLNFAKVASTQKQTITNLLRMIFR